MQNSRPGQTMGNLPSAPRTAAYLSSETLLFRISIPFRQPLSQLRIPVAVHQRVQRDPAPAVRAFHGRIRLVIRDILLCEHRIHRELLDLRHDAEKGADAADDAAVILDRLHAARRSPAGGHVRQQDDDVLTRNHWADVVAEDQLAVVVVLRLRHIDGLVGVHGHDARLRKLLGQKRADHIRPFNTYDRVHHRIVDISGRQRLRGMFRLALTRLQGRRIHIEINVGMVCRIMPRHDPDRHPRR